MSHRFRQIPGQLLVTAPVVAILAGVAFAWAAQGTGQQEPQAPTTTLKVESQVVNVLAIVRDKRGGLISNLKRDDFLLTEDNAPQEIRYFSRETDTPLTLGILIDTSVSQERVLQIEKDEAKTFVHEVIRPKDMAFVLHFDIEVELLQDFTADHRRLNQAIDGTVINGGGRGPLPGTVPGPGIGGTHLHDAIYLSATDLMKNEVGRKVLILLSDGEDQGSKIKLNQALEAAQKTDIIIYSIAIIDRMFYFGRDWGFGGESVLKRYAEQSGGRVVVVNRARDTGAAFQEIADELRTQYSLGYTPTNKNRDGSYRKIQVRIREGDYKVQARRGYYAPSS